MRVDSSGYNVAVQTAILEIIRDSKEELNTKRIAEHLDRKLPEVAKLRPSGKFNPHPYTYLGRVLWLLTQEGWVATKNRKARSGHNIVLYSITDAGLEVLHQKNMPDLIQKERFR